MSVPERQQVTARPWTEAGLTYRFHEEGDLPGLHRLWEEETGWGPLTPAIWRSRYSGPTGPSRVVVAVDRRGHIVGQMVFVPLPVSLNGREVSAFRMFAPIVARAAAPRGSLGYDNLFEHPFGRMYRYGVGALQERRATLIFGLPDVRIYRIYRRFAFLQCGSFPLWSLPLPLAPPSFAGGYTFRRLETWDSRVDHLWRQASSFLPGCHVVRDSRTLSWKISNCHHTVIAVERARALVGVVAARRREPDQWEISDLLTADAGSALRATLIAALRAGHAKALSADRIDPEYPEFSGQPLRRATLLVTPLLEPVVRCLGFRREDWEFPLAVHLLDPQVRPEDVAPARWYLTAND
jgi:hypothetical protein